MANFTKLFMIALISGRSGFQLSTPRDQHLAVSADGTVEAPILAQTASTDSHQVGIIGLKVEEFMRTLSSFESLVKKSRGPAEEVASFHQVLAQVMSQVQGKDDGSAASVIGTNAETILNAMANLKKIAHEFPGLKASEEDQETEEEADKDGDDTEQDQQELESEQLAGNASDPDKIMVNGHVVPLVEALANFKDTMYDMKRMLIYQKYMALKHNITVDSKNLSQTASGDYARVEEFLQSLQSAKDAVHEMRIKMNEQSENTADATIASSQAAEDDIMEGVLQDDGLSEEQESVLGEDDDTDEVEDDMAHRAQIGIPVNATQANSTDKPQVVENLCINNTMAPALLVLGGERASSRTFIKELQQQPGVVAIKELNIMKLMKKYGKEGQLDPRIIYRSWLGAFPECQQDGPALAVDKTPYWLIAKAPEFLYRFYGKHRKDVKLVVFMEPPLKKLQKLFYVKKNVEKLPFFQNVTFKQYANHISADEKHQSKVASQARTLKKLFQWFKAFHHSQFIIVPPRMELSLKNRGKLLREIQSLYDLPTMTKPYPFAEQYEHEDLPSLMQENMTDSELGNLREHLGSEHNIARLLALTESTLLGFKGDRRDPAEIDLWMAKNM